MVTVTEVYFRKWVEETINLDNPKLADLECYFHYLAENPYKFPSVSKSKIYMILQGIDIDSMYMGIIDDLQKILTGLFPKYSEDIISQKVHILSLVLTSLRVSTTNIKQEVGLDYQNKEDRKKYSKLLLIQILPELYQGDTSE